MKKSNDLKLVAFDLDGTLLDSAASIIAGVTECWAACGFPRPEPSAIRRIIGLPWEESIKSLLPEAGNIEMQKIKTYYEDVSRGIRPRRNRHEELFLGVEEMLAQLDDMGFILGIITSRSGGRLREILKSKGIEHYFLFVKTTDNGPGKPNPELMYQALSETGVAANAALMIGDTTFDIQMARNAGARAVGVLWGVHKPNELLSAGAESVVYDVSEICPTVTKLLGEPALGRNIAD